MKKILACFILVLLSLPAFAADEKKESVYDRVMRTNTVRCGYASWPPFFSKDVNTGAYSGLAYDLAEEMGKELSLKIEWVEEINFATMFEGYATGRYDAICAPIAPTPARARASDFTTPYVYTAFYLYARADDARFDNNHAAANDPAIKYAALDGEYSAILAKEDFPKAEYVSIPNMADGGQLLLTVATGKADVTATDPVSAINFMKTNAGKIKQVKGSAVRVLPVAFAIPPGEEKFKAMLNAALDNMIMTGFVDKVLKNYPDYDATLFRATKPYEMKK